MVNRIQVLSTLVANQIAAGEVVERPASVIKELFENAVDAQATQLVIEVGFGGLNLISVSDNGLGILKDDLRLAVAPHATSKMSTLSDLAALQTMGFRGEALASIASVSRLTIQSKPLEQTHAMQLTYDAEAGGIHESPCARQAGTLVKVQDLFYNAPVRKRFLKSARTEFLAVDKVVRSLALSVDHIHIDFLHDGKRVFRVSSATNEQTRLARVQQIFGKAFVDVAQPIEAKWNDLSLSGWIATPAYARSQQDKMLTYVNRRLVNDKLLNHAIKQAYSSVLHPGRYPACILYLSASPDTVDVNVHPMKHEVRFHDPRMVHDMIRSEIEQALTKATTAPTLVPLEVAQSTRSASVAPRALESTSDHAVFQRPSSATPAHHTTPRLSSASDRFRPEPMMRSESPALPDERWITLDAQYALVYQQKIPMILDVQRLMQDYLVGQLKQQTLPLQARPLLVPIGMTFSPAQLVTLESRFDLLAQIGLTCSWMGESRVLFRSIPVWVPQLSLQAFVEAVLQESTLTIERLFQLLAQHQGIDAMTATEIEKKTWKYYLSTCAFELQSRYLRALSRERCAAFFCESV